MAQDSETISTLSAVEETAPAVAQSVFCRELRSKRYYFLDHMPTEEAHILDGSNRCWCRLTMQVVGPDGDMAHPEGCKAGVHAFPRHRLLTCNDFGRATLPARPRIAALQRLPSPVET